MNPELSPLLHNVATPELQEAVVAKAQETLGLETLTVQDITGQTPAQICDTLIAKIQDGELISTSQKYILVDRFTPNMERLGRQEFKYAVSPGTSGSRDIQSNNTMEDFNGKPLPMYAEVMKTDQKFWKKVVIPELVLSDAWLAAEKMVEFVQLQIVEMDRAQVKDLENYLWTITVANKVDVEVDGTMEAILKEVTKTVKKYNTTSKKHFAVGTDGKEVLSTVQGDVDYQPENRFEGSEFMLITNTTDTVDYEWDTLAKVFNMSVQDVKPDQVAEIEFKAYSGIDAILEDDGTEKRAAVDLGANTKAILIHKGWLRVLDKFVYASSVKGVTPITVQHVFKEFGSYRVKGLPKPIFFTKKAGAKTAK